MRRVKHVTRYGDMRNVHKILAGNPEGTTNSESRCRN
jgi:hypothetical protein